jgi:predicted nucleic acid-binding protein
MSAGGAADRRRAGDWVGSTTAGTVLTAPELALFEAANILRRHQVTGALTSLEATLAHDDLQALPVQLWPYLPLAERAWGLPAKVTAHDACYVTLAELLATSLVTLDARLGRANGPRCPILVPPG